MQKIMYQASTGGRSDIAVSLLLSELFSSTQNVDYFQFSRDTTGAAMPAISSTKNAGNEIPEMTCPEAIADEETWAAKFAATPPEKLERLADKIRASIKAGKSRPLDFTNK